VVRDPGPKHVARYTQIISKASAWTLLARATRVIGRIDITALAIGPMVTGIAGVISGNPCEFC
jgi:hypothetical protein